MTSPKPTRILSQFALLIAVIAGLALAPSPALAQSLDSLRASGAVGERWDGLVELRDPGAGGAAKVVKDVNAKRLKIYQGEASKNNASVTDVGQIYAKQIMQKAPKGTWFLQQNGQWVQR